MAVALTLLAAAPARAARPPIPGEATVADASFVVHYPASAVTEAQARGVLDALGRAHSLFSGELGFAPPPGDAATDPTGDPRFDAYLLADGTSWLGSTTRGGAVAESTAPDASPSYFFLFQRSFSIRRIVAHEYFHAFQFAEDARETDAPSAWWAEVTAEWAGWRLYPPAPAPHQPTGTTYAGDWNGPTMLCPDRPRRGCHDGTYRFWPFAEYLALRYGTGVIAEVWREQARLGAGSSVSHARQALENVLRAHGATLASAFTGFVRTGAVTGFGVVGIKGLKPGYWPLRRPGGRSERFRVRPWGVKYVQIGAGKRGTTRLGVTGPAASEVALMTTRRRRARRIAGRVRGKRATFRIARRLLRRPVVLVMAAAGDTGRSYTVSVR